jgi:hypothetical protein
LTRIPYKIADNTSATVSLFEILPDGSLLGQRTRGKSPADRKEYDAWLGHQAWLYTRAEYGEFDLHLEYWIPAGGNSGVSIRDRSRAAAAIGETSRFLALQKEYEKAPDVTRTRLYLEAMEKILPKLQLYIIDSDKGRVPLHLRVTGP